MHESSETPKFLKCDDGFKKKRVRVCLGLAFLTFQNVLIPNTHSLSSLTQKHLLFPFLSCYPLAFAKKQLLVFRKKKKKKESKSRAHRKKMLNYPSISTLIFAVIKGLPDYVSLMTGLNPDQARDDSENGKAQIP
jgi:hypothetical protein